MCGDGQQPEQPWMPVFLRRGWARLARFLGAERGEGSAMYVRILCGAYDPLGPFIEGGCATDWMECLEEVHYPLECPRCGQRCPEELVACARDMLATRVVFVFGCPHRAFTFSRRRTEPYFDPDPESSKSDERDRPEDHRSSA